MKQKTNILFLTKNPGGFNAIFPIFKKLKSNHNYNVYYIFDKEASTFVHDKNIKLTDTERISKEGLRALVGKIRPNIVLSGTSSGSSIDKMAIDLFKGENTRTLSIVDSWVNFADRFSDLKTSNLKYMPDFIFAVDEIMSDMLTKIGVSSSKVVVTGNPFFENFKKIPASSSAKAITFICQPFSEIGDESWGFDEIQVLGDLTEILEKNYIDTQVLVKLHPRSKKKDKFLKIVKKSKLKIKIAESSSLRSLVEKSLLIVGMNSMALFEAAICGAKVLSYQPNLKREDVLVTNKIGLSLGVYKKSDLLVKIPFALKQNPKKTAHYYKKYVRSDATNKIVKFLENL